MLTKLLAGSSNDFTYEKISSILEGNVPEFLKNLFEPRLRSGSNQKFIPKPEILKVIADRTNRHTPENERLLRLYKYLKENMPVQITNFKDFKYETYEKNEKLFEQLQALNLTQSKELKSLENDLYEIHNLERNTESYNQLLKYFLSTGQFERFEITLNEWLNSDRPIVKYDINPLFVKDNDYKQMVSKLIDFGHADLADLFIRLLKQAYDQLKLPVSANLNF